MRKLEVGKRYLTNDYGGYKPNLELTFAGEELTGARVL